MQVIPIVVHVEKAVSEMVSACKVHDQVLKNCTNCGCIHEPFCLVSKLHYELRP